jgi:FRG domain-containing protein
MKTSNEVVAKNWNDIADTLFKDSWSEKLRRFRSDFAFRGMSSTEYDLQTSLQRLIGDGTALQTLNSTPQKLEKAIFRNFRKYAHRDASPGDSVWSWLAVAQHHGLPTRLLDWTISPYIGLYFATDEIDKHHLDGVVWALNFREAKKYLPKEIPELLQQEHAFFFDVPTLGALAKGLVEFDGLSKEPFPVMFEPPALDDRIVSQAGLFSMMSSPTARLDHWLENRPECFYRLIIPSSLKAEVRDKLDMMNLTERLIYGGLDGLSKWLKRYYSPPKFAQADG